MNNTRKCPSDDIAAYVDGELSAGSATELERHLEECPVCSLTLREQRQFLAALSASLQDPTTMSVPEDFARRVVSNAESTVAGVRRPNEFFTALCISGALVLFLVFAFSRDVIELASNAGIVGEWLLAVAYLLLKMAASLIFAFAVIARSLASSVDGSSAFAVMAFSTAFASVLLLSRMLRRRSA